MLSTSMDEKSFSKHREIQEAWYNGLNLQNNLFCSLKSLLLDNCDFEQYAIPSNILPCLKNLNQLTVRNCNKIKVIFDMNDNDTIETTSQLKLLFLEGLPELTSVWKKNCQGILRFQNLLMVSVRSCQHIQTLFPAALARKLTMLQRLHVDSCQEFQQIVGKEDTGTDVMKKLVFPSLTTLYLLNLPEFKYFYTELFIVECPKLNDLHVFGCPEVEGECSSTSINRPPFFSDLKAPNLREMDIGWCSSLDMSLPQFSKISEILEHLEILTMNKLSELKFIGSEDSSWLNNVWEKLCELNVHSCPDLTTLLHSTSTISFSNLKELYISECPKLNYLFTSSATKNLMHLEKIIVVNCSSMEKVMAKDKDEAPQVIELKKLRWVLLKSLSSLECFYSGYDILQLPSLKKVEISDCLNMQKFAQGSVRAKYFGGSQVSSCSNYDLVLNNQDYIAKVDQKILLQRVNTLSLSNDHDSNFCLNLMFSCNHDQLYLLIMRNERNHKRENSTLNIIQYN